MTVNEFKARFITVHKCGGCGEILDWKHSDTAFCDNCVLDWNSATVVSCPSCFKPARECACMPKRLSKSGALCHRKLFFYQSEQSYSPHMNLIFWLKKKNSKRITAFVADNMLAAVRDELDILGVCADSGELAVTSVPRSKRARALMGFDHSEKLAMAVSQRLGAEYVKVFSSTRRAKQQKTLDARQRLINARSNIVLSDTASVKDKYVALIDDMVTTGASMSVCVERLMQAGARGVLCFSLASKNKM